MSKQDTLWKHLDRAVHTGDMTKLSQLVKRNRDFIVASYPNWQRAPEEIREDQQALEHYAHTLFTVAEYFAQVLHDPILIQALAPPDEGSPMQEWQALLGSIDELRDAGEYREALDGMEALLELTGQFGGPELPHLYALVYGRYGELYLRLGDLTQSAKYTELALDASLDYGDPDVALNYLENLHEIARIANDHPAREKWSTFGLQFSREVEKRAEAIEWQLRLA
jgi:tetratricopeptide (TPR) repeat protein